jgi:hypothetical protein
VVCLTKKSLRPPRSAFFLFRYAVSCPRAKFTHNYWVLVICSSYKKVEITGRWTKSKPPVIPSVIHHLQNPLESTNTNLCLIINFIPFMLEIEHVIPNSVWYECDCIKYSVNIQHVPYHCQTIGPKYLVFVILIGISLLYTTDESVTMPQSVVCYIVNFVVCRGNRGGALCYKSEGRWFDSRWGHWIFQLTWSFQPHYSPGADSASNRNKYQESSWGGGVVKVRPARKINNLIAVC